MIRSKPGLPNWNCQPRFALAEELRTTDLGSKVAQSGINRKCVILMCISQMSIVRKLLWQKTIVYGVSTTVIWCPWQKPDREPCRCLVHVSDVKQYVVRCYAT